MQKPEGYKTEVKKMIQIREIMQLEHNVEGEEHLEVYERKVSATDLDENAFTRPNGLRENAKL